MILPAYIAIESFQRTARHSPAGSALGRVSGLSAIGGTRYGAAPFCRTHRDHELEARPVRRRRLVDDVSTMGARVGAGDCEPETGAVCSAPGFRTARESVEQAGDELSPYAFSPILDGETQVRVAPSGGHRHRRLPVPQRVGDQVREHAIE